MRRVAAIGALALLLLSCRERGNDEPRLDRDSKLDIAASEAGLIDDPATTSPVGLYQNAGVAGSDAICVAGDGANLRFGLVMHFGPTLICEGAGSASHDGGILTLRFANADCAVAVRYDGRSLRIPGDVPAGCARLCGARASISGGSMARVGWSDADSRRLTSRRDALAGRAPRALCGS